MFPEYWAVPTNVFDLSVAVIGHYVNLTTLIWVIMAPFILPFVSYSLIYLNALFVCIYGYFNYLMNPTCEYQSRDRLRYFLAVFAHCLGRVWHGYEIEGLENVPTEGAALIVYYHGAVPFDMYFMMTQVYLLKNRLIRAVMDRFFFRFPGWGPFLRLIHATKGSTESCVDILHDGHLLSIAPGGSYEAQFDGNNYRLLWRNRIGYAKVAIRAKSPIIPVFTVNIREAYRVVTVGQSWFEKWYQRWRFPFTPVYGGFPVKLRTIIGKPIAFDPASTAEELNRKVMMAIEELIVNNQTLPGSIVKALLDRVFNDKLRTKVIIHQV